MADDSVKSGPTRTVRQSDFLRVLVALAGRLAFPPDRLLQVVGRPYAGAYNMCSGELDVGSIARATGIDKSNLRKALLRWEQAGVAFRVGPEGLPLGLYSLPKESERIPGKRRDDAAPGAGPEPDDGEADGQEES